MTRSSLIWIVVIATVLLILVRPKRIVEAFWAGAGALLLLVLRLISPHDALAAVGRGTDVYLFLTGMMVLAELARREGFFDWLAVIAVSLAKGSRSRLFAIVYAVGTLVTIFLSNDATAVVLTPAVLAALKKAQAETPSLPAHLRIHSECSQLRPSDFQPGELSGVRFENAAAGDLAPILRAPVPGIDHGDFRDPAALHKEGTAGEDRAFRG